MSYLQNIFSQQLQQLVQRQHDTFPPYDIIKHDDYNYQITVALAGYAKDEIDITHNDGVIQIQRMQKPPQTDLQQQQKDLLQYVHRGIAKRNFRLNFPVNEHMVVKDASMENGLLVVNMQLIIPENNKSKTILIS